MAQAHWLMLCCLTAVTAHVAMCCMLAWAPLLLLANSTSHLENCLVRTVGIALSMAETVLALQAAISCGCSSSTRNMLGCAMASVLVPGNLAGFKFYMNI